MNVSQAQSFLRKILATDIKSKKINLTPIFLGAMGVGKSSIVKQNCDADDYYMEEVRLNTLSIIDVRGIPYVPNNNSIVDHIKELSSNNLVNLNVYEDLLDNQFLPEHFNFIPPPFFPIAEDNLVFTVEQLSSDKRVLKRLKKAGIPLNSVNDPKGTDWVYDEQKKDRRIKSKKYVLKYKDGQYTLMKKPVVLFFDEITVAPPQNQLVALEISLDRRMGGHDLPTYVFDDQEFPTMVILAGNREQDKSNVFQMSYALANRLVFVHMDHEGSLDDYILRFIEREVSDSIIAFIKFNPNALHKMPQKAGAFPSPRMWEMLDVYLKDWGIPEFDEHNHYKAGTPQIEICGFIGEDIGPTFFAYYKHAKKLPDLDKVLAGKELFKPDSTDLAYFYITSLTTRLIRHSKEYYKKPDSRKTSEEIHQMVHLIENYLKALDTVGGDPKAFGAFLVSNDITLTLLIKKDPEFRNRLMKETTDILNYKVKKSSESRLEASEETSTTADITQYASNQKLYDTLTKSITTIVKNTDKAFLHGKYNDFKTGLEEIYKTLNTNRNTISEDEFASLTRGFQEMLDKKVEEANDKDEYELSAYITKLKERV